MLARGPLGPPHLLRGNGGKTLGVFDRANMRVQDPPKDNQVRGKVLTAFTVHHRVVLLQGVTPPPPRGLAPV